MHFYFDYEKAKQFHSATKSLKNLSCFKMYYECNANRLFFSIFSKQLKYSLHIWVHLSLIKSFIEYLFTTDITTTLIHEQVNFDFANINEVFQTFNFYNEDN